MKDPAFLFYSSDFLTGTILMSNEQVGKYIKLLCLQHQIGHLKEEDLYQIIDKNDTKILSKFIKDSEGKYYNERLELEIEKRSKHKEKQRENGLKGGRPKNPNKTQTKPKRKPLENENENENINVNIYNNIYFNNKELNSIFIDFLEMRKKLKAVNSDRAINTLINKLNNYDDETKYKMIEQSIENSWKGLFELKKSYQPKKIIDDKPTWLNQDIQPDIATVEEVEEFKKRLASYCE